MAFLAEAKEGPVGFCVIGDLPWESGVLGKRMAAVKHMAAMPEKEHSRILEALVSRALAYTRDRNYDFLLCKSYTDDSPRIHALERQGFLLVDTLLDFVVDLRRVPPAIQPAPAVPVDVELRFAGPGDLAGLVEVSRRAFASHPGRFHSDSRLGPECGRIIYERWIESCLNGWADWVVVAETAGRIAGYSAWKRPSDREARHQLDLGHYSIGAVHPDFFGRGLFSASLSEAQPSWMVSPLASKVPPTSTTTRCSVATSSWGGDSRTRAARSTNGSGCEHRAFAISHSIQQALLCKAGNWSSWPRPWRTVRSLAMAHLPDDATRCWNEKSAFTVRCLQPGVHTRLRWQHCYFVSGPATR